MSAFLLPAPLIDAIVYGCESGNTVVKFNKGYLRTIHQQNVVDDYRIIIPSSNPGLRGYGAEGLFVHLLCDQYGLGISTHFFGISSWMPEKIRMRLTKPRTYVWSWVATDEQPFCRFEHHRHMLRHIRGNICCWKIRGIRSPSQKNPCEAPITQWLDCSTNLRDSANHKLLYLRQINRYRASEVDFWVGIIRDVNREEKRSGARFFSVGMWVITFYIYRFAARFSGEEFFDFSAYYGLKLLALCLFLLPIFSNNYIRLLLLPFQAGSKLFERVEPVYDLKQV